MASSKISELTDGTQFEPGDATIIVRDGVNWKVDPTKNAVNAWVNFNGTGTVAIRASYNVSSITDNGTGDYTVNFTTALSDTNYAVCGMSRSTSSTGYMIYGNNASGNATGSVRISTSSTTAFADSDTISVAVIR